MARFEVQPNGSVLKFWEPGESGNPKGRPPKIFKFVKDEMERQGMEPCSREDITDAIKQLLALPISDLKDIAGSAKTENEWPIVYRLIAAELMGPKRLDAFTRFHEIAFGKPKQETSLSIETPEGALHKLWTETGT